MFSSRPTTDVEDRKEICMWTLHEGYFIVGDGGSG